MKKRPKEVGITTRQMFKSAKITWERTATDSQLQHCTSMATEIRIKIMKDSISAVWDS